MEETCVNFLDPVFFHYSRDVAMATNLVSYFSFSIGAKVSQDLLDRISQSLHRVVGIELRMINLAFFFRYLKGHCYGNQFCGKIVAKLPTPFTYHSVIPKRSGISLPQCAH